MARLERQANALLLNSEELEWRLPSDVRARLQSECETDPNDVDRALHAFHHPHHEVIP
jgi:hypothetical protein